MTVFQTTGGLTRQRPMALVALTLAEQLTEFFEARASRSGRGAIQEALLLFGFFLQEVEGLPEFSIEQIGTKNGKPVYPNYTRMYVSATDKKVGTESITYAMDGGPQSLYSSPQTLDASEVSRFRKNKKYEEFFPGINDRAKEKEYDDLYFLSFVTGATRFH